MPNSSTDGAFLQPVQIVVLFLNIIVIISVCAGVSNTSFRVFYFTTTTTNTTTTTSSSSSSRFSGNVGLSGTKSAPAIAATEGGSTPAARPTHLQHLLFITSLLLLASQVFQLLRYLAFNYNGTFLGHSADVFSEFDGFHHGTYGFFVIFTITYYSSLCFLLLASLHRYSRLCIPITNNNNKQQKQIHTITLLRIISILLCTLEITTTVTSRLGVHVFDTIFFICLAGFALWVIVLDLVMNAKLIHTTVTGIYTQGILQQVVVVVVAEEEGEGKEEQGRYEEEKDVEKSVGGFAPKPIIIMMEETGRLSHTEDMNHLPENRVSASAIATKHVSITTNVSSSTRQGAPPRISITASAPSVSPAPRTSCVNSNDGRRRGSSIVSSHNQLLRQTLKYKLFAMYAGVVVLDTVALILELLGLLGVNFALTFPDMDALAVLASSIHVLVSMQILERVRNGVLEINNKN